MRLSTFSLLAAVTTLTSPAHAVKGVISDTLTEDEQGCRSLCGLTQDCLMELYQWQCQECWLLDCKLEFIPEGLMGAGKHTIAVKPKCDNDTLIPTPRDDQCNGAPSADATTDGTAGTSDAGTNGATVFRMSIGWQSLGTVVAAAVLAV